MGEVYRAHDPRLGRDVAIKVLPSAFSADSDRLHRFEQEARAASALNHPNILSIYDVGTHNGSPYIVSELLEGETLRERLGRAAPSFRKAINYAVQIAQGLAAAHEKGIVHRDLKPENLFVTKDGRVKILDFGLAKLTQPEGGSGSLTQAPTITAATEPGVVLGTVGYMSPEQVRGQPADHRADIFALGAIFYEMLSGRHAFRADSAIETMNAILKEEPPALRRLEGDSSLGLERIVRRCLEKTPDERFHSARDLAFALGEILTGAEVARAVPAPWAARRIRFRWIAAAGLAILALAFLWSMGGLRKRVLGVKPPRIESLAVLPLENLSRDPEQEYFADGMTEALITDLAQIGALRVISRTSVMQYKGVKKPLSQIARELNVDGVVEGSVLRAGDRVRITAQLVHAPTDRHLWAKSYERDLRNVLALQAEVSRAIADQIQLRLNSQEQARFASARPVNTEAYEAYLRGTYQMRKLTATGVNQAIEDFQRAIGLQPDFASAYAALAEAYITGGFTHLSPKESKPHAAAAVAKALEIDAALAEAHNSLALVRYTFEWDWEGAEREFQRAIALNPGYALAHDWYGFYLAMRGRKEEAAREIRRALDLDPLSPWINTDLGEILRFARQYDQAIEQYQKAIELEPNFWPAHFLMGWAYLHEGDLSAAIAAFEKARSLDDDPSALAALGHAFAVAGKKSEARRVLAQVEEISKRRYVSPYWLAAVHVGLGDHDRAFEWLEKAYEDRTVFITFVKVDPVMDVLRSDPRYAALLRRVGLPP